jgi:hypothetical protein
LISAKTSFWYGILSLSTEEFPNQKDTSEMNANSTRTVIVERGGTQVVDHVGLHALGLFADRLGVNEALSGAVGWPREGVDSSNADARRLAVRRVPILRRWHLNIAPIHHIRGHNPPEQTIHKLHEDERMLNDGQDLTDALKQVEIAESTWNRCRNQYGSMNADGAKKLKELEIENSRLKKLLAEVELEKTMLKEFAEGEW